MGDAVDRFFVPGHFSLQEKEKRPWDEVVTRSEDHSCNTGDKNVTCNLL